MILKRIPTILILVLFWAALRFWGGVDLRINSTWALSLVFACFVATIFEFYKSSDITVAAFKLDMIFAVITVAAASAFATAFVCRQSPWYSDWYLIDSVVVITAMIDGFFSPLNSFRCALRNWQGDQAIDDSQHHH